MRSALSAPAALLLCACSDASLPTPRIDRLDPSALPPGATLLIEGAGFGTPDVVTPDHHGTAAAGGRHLQVLEWSDSVILARLPADMAGGATLVVVRTERGVTPPAPLLVQGDRVRGTGPRRFPPVDSQGDAGARDGPAHDAGHSRDARASPDAGQELAARFFSDPAGRGDLSLIPLDAPVGRLRLQIDLPAGLAGDAWGVALHLAYDRNLLALLDVAPASDDSFHAAEIGPGRLALGRVRPPQQVAVLTFRLIGPGEGRVEIPARHRTVRDASNRSLPGIAFVGGTVQVRVLAP